VECCNTPPTVALNTLHNAFGFIVVIQRQVVRLHDFQRKRNLGKVDVMRDAALQLLSDSLAITQPCTAYLPLHLRTGQLARRLWLQAPLRPCRLDLRSQFRVNFAGQADRQWLHTNARTAHHPLFMPVK
jgi:hypothetical protein